MVNLTVKKAILRDLEQLPIEKQRRAQQLVHGLLSPLPKGATFEELSSLAGILDDESAREMRVAIEQEFERVDPHAW